MKDWTELEVMLRFQALTVELLQRQIGGYSKILAEYQGNAWDVLVACNHDPVDSPVTSEGRARLVMKPTIHMPVSDENFNLNSLDCGYEDGLLFFFAHSILNSSEPCSSVYGGVECLQISVLLLNKYLIVFSRPCLVQLSHGTIFHPQLLL